LKIKALLLTLTSAALLAACSANEANNDRQTDGAVAPTAPLASPSPDDLDASEGQELILSLEDELEAELTVADQPDWMAVGYGSTWVARDEAGAMDRIDPRTDEVVATIKVGDHPCVGMAAAFGSIWVPSCSKQAVYRISAASEDVEAVVKVPVFKTFSGTGPFGGFAAGVGAVWIVTEGKSGAFDVLARIDPRSNEVTDEISLGHGRHGGRWRIRVGAISVHAARQDRPGYQQRGGAIRGSEGARWSRGRIRIRVALRFFGQSRVAPSALNSVTISGHLSPWIT
jgi:streptogramin lyase